MSVSELELRPLRLADEKSFFAALQEFRDEEPFWNFAIGYVAGEPFAEYVRKNAAWARGEELPADWVPSAFYVGVVRDEIVGRVSLRFELNDFLARIGGHIGYGVRASQRGKGYATRLLQLALPQCRERGIARALLTCDVTNAASRRVIERCGGVFESITTEPELEVQKRRYWVPTGSA